MCFRNGKSCQCPPMLCSFKSQGCAGQLVLKGRNSKHLLKYFFLGHRHWSITPPVICYGHFVLWAGINLTHCPFKRSQWRKFSVTHRCRRRSLHCNSKTRKAQVAISGLRMCRKPNFIYFSFFLVFGMWGGVLINCWFKQHDCWQHTPPLNLTALIKLTVAIKHIPRKYVSNDTCSTAGHLCRKLYSKILLKPATAQDQSSGWWEEGSVWIIRSIF